MTEQIQICQCDRCGRRCRVSEKPSDPKAQPIRKSLVPKGCCVDCAITCYIRTGALADVVGGRWTASGFHIEALRMPHIQQQFAAIFKAGRIAEAGEEIDWGRVIANWELPIPKKGWDWQGER